MRRNDPSRRASQRGMAMLEVLVSILLLSLGLLGLIGLQTRSVLLSVEADYRNSAALVANEIATSMWLKSTVSITTSEGGARSWDSRVADALPQGKILIAQLSEPNTADITVRWFPPQRRADEASYSELRTRVTLLGMPP